MNPLRISPLYTSMDWTKLDAINPDDWIRATDIVRDRLDGRFLNFASKCLKNKYSGFVVLAIDSLLAETIQQFKEGIVDGSGKAGTMIRGFLASQHFQPDFNQDVRESFYIDIRCGLLHQAEAKGLWLLRRNQPAMIQERKEDNSSIYIIDVKRFHRALCASFNEYLEMIQDPSQSKLRANLWIKMNAICNVRISRGAFYGLED